MSANAKSRVSSASSVDETAALNAGLAQDVIALAPRMQSLLDSLHIGDSMEFHAALQKELDDPAFDPAFKAACAKNPHLADAALREALRGAAVISKHGSENGCERITDIFVLPVTGPVERILELAGDASAMAALERSFRDAGLLAPDGRVALSDTPLRPDLVVNATPGVLRRLHRAFERFAGSKGAAADRAILEMEVDDFETACHPESRVNAARGTATFLFVGFYSREYRLTSFIELDAMTSQINNADAHGEHDECLEAFEELARDVTGLDVSLPHWPGRGCAAAALETVRAHMEAEALCYGKDLAVSGLDAIACARRGDVTLVEGEIDGNILGPFAFPASLVKFEPEWASESLEEMARAVLPSGRLEYGRSASLN
ncbi:hypothetical protein OIU34_22750 [Pararhizobium sp. BT-229]|uniref:hypothetical protein n=1 Tax=Pararhizobium sp. BT-229 TaxID=2986923 RepID=UPI0021F6B323|nr:hypothetical protein [Pararhizobium sp. BT-229]MCV9964714.1 hypothetical protein [Pararhizobium sp. BT-229]